MKQYETTRVLWLKGLLVEVGTKIDLSDAEAKYIRHALKDAVVAAPAAVEAEAETVAEPAVAPTAPVEVEAVVKHARRRAKVEADHGDDH